MFIQKWYASAAGDLQKQLGNCRPDPPSRSTLEELLYLGTFAILSQFCEKYGPDFTDPVRKWFAENLEPGLREAMQAFARKQDVAFKKAFDESMAFFKELAESRFLAKGHGVSKQP